VNLIERMEATQKTVDRWKLKNFDPGKYDCIQMMVAHARLCHRRIRVPPYGDMISARRSMHHMGFKTIGEGMDKYFQRIEPHRAIMGDFIEMPGTDAFTAITVSVGNGRVLGFHEEIGFADILEPLLISGAWSVDS
jgi:hypothetical protein